MKIERNELCFCGSEKKYKKCCLLLKEKTPANIDLEDDNFIIPLIPEVDQECDDALASLEVGDVAGAKIVAERLSRLYPDYHMVSYLQGVCSIKEEQFTDAIFCFEKAIQIYPYFSAAHYNLSILYRQNFMISKSVKSLIKVIEIEGENGEIGRLAKKELNWLETMLKKSTGLSLEGYLKGEELYNQALSCLTAKNYEAAIDFFRQVIKTQPRHVQSFGNMGIAYGALGNQNLAFECFDRALAIDPSYEPAKRNRKIAEQLKEGEGFNLGIEKTDYYKERFLQERVR